MKSPTVQVLLVEDDLVDQMAFLRHVKQEKLDYETRVASSLAAARAALAQQPFDIIVLDHTLPDGLSFELLESVPDIPVIYITGSESPRNAVKAMKMGARDYLVKDPDRNYLQLLPTSVERALKQARAEQEQIQMQAQLRESQEHLNSLINSVDGIVWEADAVTFQFTFVSQRAERLLGFPASQWIEEANFWVNHLHPADRDAAVECCARNTREKRDHEFEYRMLTEAGRTVWLRDFVTVVIERDQPVKIRGIMVDITERRELEEQLRQSKKMEAIGRLAGGVAHDFNNISTVIIMQTDLLKAFPDLPDEVHDGLREIRAAADRAVSLTRQLLLFSRRQVLNTQDLDLNAVVTSLTRMLRRIIGEHVQMKLQLHAQPLMTRSDAGMLDQVLLNLAVNARDAMPKGGRLLIETMPYVLDEQEARLYPDTAPGSFVCLCVSDTGCGIPADVLPRIFDPFFTTKEQGKGTGLGLATVYGIVKQHHGWIKVESEANKGTKFQIFLPAHSSVAKEVVQESVPPTPRIGTETILLAEDEPMVRLLTRKFLERSGYRVLEAASGDEALEVWQAHPGEIGLLLTDLVMPGSVNGHELARQLQAIRPTLKVLFTSGYSPEIAGKELSLEEGQNFVQKPCPPDKLLEIVRRCLDV